MPPGSGRCLHCRCLFVCNPRLKDQRYCGRIECQRVRKRLWQRHKMAVDVDYLPLGTQGSNLFFQVISQRHERKSTVITTNLPFADWGTIFDSTTVATAIADRLVYNSDILILESSSYRKRSHKTNTS